MIDESLGRRAASYGVATSYENWRGEAVEVPAETVRAVLRVLEPGPYPGQARAEPPAGSPAGGRPSGDPSEVPSGERPVVPPERAWGFMTQLYSLRSRGSWGYGDLRDLADLAAWSGRALGAGFVLVNPLHADDPVPPIEPSPYLPMSRRFSSPLYLRVEDVPEYARAPEPVRQRIAELSAPLRAADHTLDPLDREAVWAAKRAALELLHGLRPRVAAVAPDEPAEPGAPVEHAASGGAVASGEPAAPGEPVDPPDIGDMSGNGGGAAPGYAAFLERESAALRTFATWCALAELHGGDWQRWPAGLRAPDADAVAAERARLAPRVDFYAWLQWLLDRQLAAAQDAARAAGMPIGVVHDLALGVHPGGADAWMYQDLLALDMRVGAPPDEFNQRGQDWGQPPWHPGRLAAARYEPLREMLRHSLRHGGGLRIDHVMQLFRLWWVPAGEPAADGTYVRYDHAAMLDVIGAEARRAGALVVGEDLGTVEPWMRDALAERHLLGTSMLWFERDAAGRPRPPGDWRALCLATVATHDLPPLAGYLKGDHVRLRERLGLLTRPVAEEAAAHRRQLADWARLLARLGLLPEPSFGAAADGATEAGPGDASSLRRATTALHGFLARTPARLVGVSLADAVGERRTQNQPGTADEYPNWRVPLADVTGAPVLLDDLPRAEWVRAVVAPVAGAPARRPG